MELGEFTDLVSTALHFEFDASLNLDFTPSTRPSHSHSAPTTPEKKPKVIHRIKSLLIRAEKHDLPQCDTPPPLPLPPPSDPVFTPFVPLVVEAEMRRRRDEDIEQDEISSCYSSSGSSSEHSHSACSTPSTSPAKSLSLSERCISSDASASFLPSLCDPDLDTVINADPFAKGRVQVLPSPSPSTSAYSMHNHPYASSSCASSASSSSSSASVYSNPAPRRKKPLHIHAQNLPPLLPMPKCPLPAVPSSSSQPRPSHDWTLDLPLSDSSSESSRVVSPTRSTKKRTRRVSGSFGQPKRAIQLQVEAVRPGHRRKGSPFPLTLSLPTPSSALPPTPTSDSDASMGSPTSLSPTSPTSTSSTTSTPNGDVQNHSRSPRAHRLTLDRYTGLPVPKPLSLAFPLPPPPSIPLPPTPISPLFSMRHTSGSEPATPSESGFSEVPVTPTESRCSEVPVSAAESGCSVPGTPPSDGRCNMPGWFFDDDSESDEEEEVVVGRKMSGDSVYYTASEV
ncbi:hypothetical protein VNI00_009110 [Paramarasmius palmivorus]|uniref:Uncharacterized protein n=1 Tax=Paramarasmius palmivorus TaxID=297713 RepID=A0AAW0CT15_9AGAR